MPSTLVPWRFRYFTQRIAAGFPSPTADYMEDGQDILLGRITHGKDMHAHFKHAQTL